MNGAQRYLNPLRCSRFLLGPIICQIWRNSVKFVYAELTNLLDSHDYDIGRAHHYFVCFSNNGKNTSDSFSGSLPLEICFETLASVEYLPKAVLI
jgi:hypothetical protein